MLNLEHSNAVKRESSMWAQLAHGLENCPVGQGFALDLPEGSNVAAFRSKVSKKAKTLNKRFTVKKLIGSTFEITRLEDEDSQDNHVDVKFDYFPSTQSKPRADLSMQDVWALIQDLFMGCPEGMSFAIRLGEDKMMLPKLKTMMTQKNQSHNRNFEVIAQPQGWFELARREIPQTYDVQPIGWSLEK